MSHEEVLAHLKDCVTCQTVMRNHILTFDERNKLGLLTDKEKQIADGCPKCQEINPTKNGN